MGEREKWGTKLGVVLAVAGSAIGLGNFLRFPVKAASYGGGAFMIPYFVAFILLAVPLAWMEWTMGRYGGERGHGTGPGILDVMVKRPWARYVGSIGIFGPMLIAFYYIYIESWLLGFTWYAVNGELMEVVRAGEITRFFGEFITLQTTIGGIPSALIFFLITFLINFGILYFGIRRGIETASKLILPVMMLLGIILLIRVLTVPGIVEGLAFMWNPDFSRLSEPRVWLEASGQVFFTMSVGIGVILTYASYVRKHEDIALSAVSAAGANGFAEVILGGTIVIPMAVVVFGAANLEEVAKMGTFGLGFQSMPIIFGGIPAGQLFQAFWFAMLFLAGVTSSISILQPAFTFLEDELSFSRKKTAVSVGAVQLIAGLLAVFGLTAGAVDELDFWGGTLMLVLFGTVEAIVFAWIFGAEQGMEELRQGAEIELPRRLLFVLKWVTPIYLIVLLVAWVVTDGWEVITLAHIDPQEMVTFLGAKMAKLQFLWGVRLFLLVIFFLVNGLIWWAWRKKRLLSVGEGKR